MKLIHDYFIVSVDQRYETKKGNLASINTAIFRDSQDAPEQRDDAHYRHKRLWGTILTCPQSFTDETVDLIDPGKPAYGVFIGHEYISWQIRQGYRGRAVPAYRCSTFDKFERTTRIDYAKMMDVREGDRVYFSYLTTEPENLLGKDKKGNDIYKLILTDIFCVVRRERHPITGRYKDKIHMQGDWLLAEPNMETWQEITTPSGIIRKPEPEARYLEATIRHVRKRPGLNPGDKIYYEPIANVPLEVEGKTYYCMKESEVLCLI